MKYPLLWLPLVLADALRTLLQWYAQPLTRNALLAAAPRSALGGGIAGPPPQWKIDLIAGGIGFAALVLGLFLLLYALGVVARAVKPHASVDRQRPQLHFQIPEGILPAWLRVSGLAAVFFVYSTVFLYTAVVPWAAKAHMRPGTVQWLLLAFVVPAFLLMLYLAVNPLRRYVQRVQDQPEKFAGERLPYFLLLAAAALCSNLASFGIAYLTRRAVPAGQVTPALSLLLLQVLTSVASALPYAYAMAGFSLSPTEGTTPADGA